MLADTETQVIQWRLAVLEEAGFPPDYALGLAQNPDVDLHRAIDLLECGCDVETAMRILS